SHVKSSTWLQLPCPVNHPLTECLILRTLRMNCLVSQFSALWSELYNDSWLRDEWASDASDGTRISIGEIGPSWNSATPFRISADRRRALIEIDAIVAVMLGITAEELLTIYRTQFPVLQRYEREARYDANG